MLFGGAGFLEAPDLAVYGKEARDYVRELWHRWWPHRAAMHRLILPTKLWRLSGTRPLNHPQRRLGALATLIQSWSSFTRSLTKKNAKAVHDFLIGLSHPFWNFHYTLGSTGAKKTMALIGESRIAEILANVLLPFFFAEGVDVWNEYEQLPSQLSNRRLKTGVSLRQAEARHALRLRALERTDPAANRLLAQ